MEFEHFKVYWNHKTFAWAWHGLFLIGILICQPRWWDYRQYFSEGQLFLWGRSVHLCRWIVGFFIPILIVSIQRLLIAFYLDFEGFANFHGHAHCQVQDPALTLRADHQPEQYWFEWASDAYFSWNHYCKLSLAGTTASPQSGSGFRFAQIAKTSSTIGSYLHINFINLIINSDSSHQHHQLHHLQIHLHLYSN